MPGQKEISVRTVTDETEQERYEKYFIYRREGDLRMLLYFAPNYPGIGLSAVSRILGKITLTPKDYAGTAKLKEQLEPFARKAFTENPEEIMRKWLTGIRLTKTTDKPEKPFHYILLDRPWRMPVNVKATLVKGADGKISLQATEDLGLTFDEFFAGISEARTRS